MPEWLYILLLFAGMSASYWCGVGLGSARADRAPNAEAWREVRFRSIDAKKECELRAISCDHEETMALIARGALDGVELDAPGNDKKEDA